MSRYMANRRGASPDEAGQSDVLTEQSGVNRKPILGGTADAERPPTAQATTGGSAEAANVAMVAAAIDAPF